MHLNTLLNLLFERPPSWLFLRRMFLRWFHERRRYAPRRSFRPECLETRLCLTAITFAEQNGSLVIRGNDDPNDITVQLDGGIQIVDDGEVIDTGFTDASIDRLIVYGGGANDRIEIADSVAIPARLYGQDGDDVLTGSSGADYLDGGLGVDQIFSQGGDDTLVVDADDTITDGGEGRDRINARRSPAAVNIDMAASDVEIAYGSDYADQITASGLGERAVIYGYAGNDVLIGSDFNDVIRGQDGDDNIRGGDGNDNVQGNAGADSLAGQGGDDTLVVDADDTVTDGGEGRDRINARRSPAAVNIDMAASDVEIAYGSDYADQITASGLGERAVIYGYAGNDVLIGSDFNDVIRGQDGDDDIRGGDGNDNVQGNAGADSLAGQGGDDTLVVDADDTVTDGGEGRDRINARRSPAAVIIDMAASNVEIAYGSDFADTIYALAYDDNVRIYSYGADNHIWVFPASNGARIDVRGKDGDRLTILEPVDATSTDIPKSDGTGSVVTSDGYGVVAYRAVELVEIIGSEDHPAFELETQLDGTILSEDVFADGLIEMPAVQLNGGGIRVVLQNTSDSDMGIQDISAEGGFRAVFGGKGVFEGGDLEPLFPRTISAGQSFAFDLVYSNPRPGTTSGVLRIESDDSQRPLNVVPIRGEVLYEPDVQILAGLSGVDFGDPSEMIDFGTFPAGETAFIPLTIYNNEYQVVTLDPSESNSTVDFFFIGKGEFEDESGTDRIEIPEDFAFSLTDILGLHPVGRQEITFDVGIDQPATAQSPGIIQINRSGGEPLEFRYLIDFAAQRDVVVTDDTGRSILDGSNARSFGALAADPSITIDKTRSFTVTNDGISAKAITSLSVSGDFEFSSPGLPAQGVQLAPGESFSFDVTAIPAGQELSGTVVINFASADSFDFAVSATLESQSKLTGWIGSDGDYVPGPNAIQSSLEGGQPVVRTNLSLIANRWYLLVRNTLDYPQSLRYESDINGIQFLSAPEAIGPGGSAWVEFQFPVDQATYRTTGYVQISSADGRQLPMRVDFDLSFQQKGGFE